MFSKILLTGLLFFALSSMLVPVVFDKEFPLVLRFTILIILVVSALAILISALGIIWG